jgi:hypothetical protein
MTVKAPLRIALKRTDCASLMRFFDAIFILVAFADCNDAVAVYQFSSAR